MSGQTGSSLPVQTWSSTGPAVSTTGPSHRSSIGSSGSCRRS